MAFKGRTLKNIGRIITTATLLTVAGTLSYCVYNPLQPSQKIIEYRQDLGELVQKDDRLNSSVRLRELAYDSTDSYRSHAQELMVERNELKSQIESNSEAIAQMKEYESEERTRENAKASGILAALCWTLGPLTTRMGKTRERQGK
jgi:hypothetical protein